MPSRASRADAAVRPHPSLSDGPLSDAGLIASSVTSPERFGEIYQRHVSEIHRHLARRVGAALADDLAAETFLVAFGSRHRYDRAAERALPWLFGIATNLLRRHSRTERAQYRSLARTRPRFRSSTRRTAWGTHHTRCWPGSRAIRTA